MNQCLNKTYAKGGERPRAIELAGVVTALYKDYLHDRLDTFAEIVRGEIYADFISLATHLLEEDRKGNASVNAAAVLTGGVLEEHLRNLCAKATPPIPLDYKDCKGNPHRKTLEKLNTDLKAAGVYPTGDFKLIVGWTDIRNQAAHKTGLNQADHKKVELMLIGVRDFIVRYPA
jgi:hypothetical protein